jgi:hypothetical protein
MNRWLQPERLTLVFGMADRVRKLLLGYLIGALDDSERRRIEQRLQRDPKWQAELAAARESLEPLRSAQRTYEPPPGLASRTCQWVAMTAPSATEPAAQAPARPGRARQRARRMTAAVVPPDSRASWSWVDVSVAAAILVTLSMLIFPAVQRNRAHARMMACQNNLREFGGSVAQLQQRHPELPCSRVDRGAPVSVEPNASLVLASLAPGAAPPSQEASPWPVLPEMRFGWLDIPRPGHHGLSDSVWGENTLFGDGRVTFVTTELGQPFGGNWIPEQSFAIPAPALTVLFPSAGRD